MKKNKLKRKINDKKQTKTLFKVSDVTKKFRLSETQIISVFEKINLNIREGEILGVFGPSGSGKSTLINLLAGIDEIDSGSILYNETEISKLTIGERDKLRSKNFSFLVSDINIISNLSVKDNIELHILATGVGTLDAAEKVKSTISDFKLESISDKNINTLDNIGAHLAMLASAFAVRPKVLFIDEFGMSLSSSEKQSVYEQIISYAKSHTITVIIASDDIAICSKANRIIRFENGKVS